MSSIKRMVNSFWLFIFSGDYRKAILFVFTGSIVLRAHTLFIDFIHIDVVTSYLLVKRDLAGLDFNPNKGWLNHQLVKLSVLLFGDSVESFHLTGIVFILLTMIFILLLGRKIYNTGTGIAAAMLYGFIISSYNTEFTATNGEVIYNLFFMSSFYFAWLYISGKKLYAIPALAVSLLLGALVKFQGGFAFLAIGGYILLARPFFREGARPEPRRYFFTLAAVLGLGVIILVADWKYFHVIFNKWTQPHVQPFVKYVANRGLNPFMVAGKLILRSIHFLLYHSIVWIPGTIAVINYFRAHEKKEGDAYLVVIAIVLFFSIFLGGARLSVHYFIPVLPVLSILAAAELRRRFIAGIDMSRITMFFFVPVIFFFSWNVKDALTRNYFPELKQKEGHFASYFRIIMLASHGEYLLPHPSIIPAIEYIKNNTSPEDRIMSWPMGTEMTYYTGRYSAGYSYWYNESALYAIVQREKGNVEVYDTYQKNFITHMKKLMPDCFIDLGATIMIRKVLVYRKKTDPPYYFDWNSVPMFRFGSFASLDDFPAIIKYLNRHYTFAGTCGKARIWVRKK